MRRRETNFRQKSFYNGRDSAISRDSAFDEEMTFSNETFDFQTQTNQHATGHHSLHNQLGHHCCHDGSHSYSGHRARSQTEELTSNNVVVQNGEEHYYRHAPRVNETVSQHECTYHAHDTSDVELLYEPQSLRRLSRTYVGTDRDSHARNERTQVSTTQSAVTHTTNHGQINSEQLLDGSQSSSEKTCSHTCYHGKSDISEYITSTKKVSEESSRTCNHHEVIPLLPIAPKRASLKRESVGAPHIKVTDIEEAHQASLESQKRTYLTSTMKQVQTNEFEAGLNISHINTDHTCHLSNISFSDTQSVQQSTLDDHDHTIYDHETLYIIVRQIEHCEVQGPELLSHLYKISISLNTLGGRNQIYVLKTILKLLNSQRINDKSALNCIKIIYNLVTMNGYEQTIDDVEIIPTLMSLFDNDYGVHTKRIQFGILGIMNKIIVMKADEFGHADLFNYIWHKTIEELEITPKHTKLIVFYISIISNLFATNNRDLCEQFIKSPDFEVLVNTAIHEYRNSEVALFPILTSLNLLCSNSPNSKDARIQSVSLAPTLVQHLKGQIDNISYKGQTNYAFLKNVLILLRFILSEKENIEKCDTMACMRVLADLFFGICKIYQSGLPADPRRLKCCRLTINELLESCLGTMHVLARDRKCLPLISNKAMIDMLCVNQITIDGKQFGLSLHSLDLNIVRHSIGILSELASIPQNIIHIRPYEGEIFDIFIKSLYESICFYCANCLFSINPRNKKRIESILFINGKTSHMCQGNMFEKWIKRRKKETVVVLPPPAVAQDVDVEADVKAQTSIQVTSCSFAMVDQFCEDLTIPGVETNITVSTEPVLTVQQDPVQSDETSSTM